MLVLLAVDIRNISVAGRHRIAYTCGWNPIRAPQVDRCEFFLREPGADYAMQRRGRWRVAGIAS
ncbi:MAG: hypothetical protein ACR2HE_09680 [Casimicrobiaceae bacterium]